MFLSHSSADKETVFRLAVDIAARGIPLWLDAWSLEIGDSLVERILDGIDESSVLIVAFSPRAVESGWVARELESALKKEKSEGRRFVIPILLEHCSLPTPFEDRLYVDFSSGYSNALETLEGVLRRSIKDIDKVPVRDRTLPLRIRNGIDLDGVSLQSTFDHLVPMMKKGQSLEVEQIAIVPERDYGALRRAAGDAVDQMERENYPADVVRYLQQSVQSVRRIESMLPVGVATIGNGLFAMNDWASLAMVAESYVRLVRTELIFRLIPIWSFVNKSDPPPLVVATDFGGPTSSPEAAAAFYGVKRVRSFDVFPNGQATYFKVWLDENSEVAEWVRTPQPLRHYFAPDMWFRFILPQMVWYYSLNRQAIPPPSEVVEWMIGPA